MSGVRPFDRETDLHQVADLHRLVFGREQPARRDYLRSYERHLSDVFLNNPWRDPALPSLVYEDDDGRVAGFLGVIPRRMSMNGTPLRVAISAEFMVHPRARGRTGLCLLKAFLSGPQELSLTEGNDRLRTVWEGLDGTTLLPYSIRWTRPLRPSRFALSFTKRHEARSSTLASILTPLAGALDGVLGRLEPWPFRVSPCDGTRGEELTENAFLAGLSKISSPRPLHPCYDERSVTWLFATLAEKNGRGRFRKALVRNAAGEPAGWYLYYANPGGVSETVQVAARDGAMPRVLDHLFHDAWARGAIGVSGQLDPGFIQSFSEASCLLHGSGGSWILAHAKRPERLKTLRRGEAWFTRLEGEWWVGF